MDAAIVLARFWGIILVVLSGSMLINAKFYVRLVKGFQDESVMAVLPAAPANAYNYGSGWTDL